MRILMLGAGAIGGYFGGRMVAAGSDVTFLVRRRRAAQLGHGLRIESPYGDATISVKFITDAAQAGEFDVVILSCKAYGLAGALDAIAPQARPGIPILPLLNGFAHLEVIERRFPDAIVWGGAAGIAATLTEDGTVRQMNDSQIIAAGPRENLSNSSALLDDLVAQMVRAQISATVDAEIDRVMFEKWTFLATLAAVTCLMRGSIGEILATDHGEDLIKSAFDECNRTAIAEGYPPREPRVPDYPSMLFDRTSSMTASLLRDMEAESPTEADHIIGNMIERAARHGIATPTLNAAYSRLQVYEARRAM